MKSQFRHARTLVGALSICVLLGSFNSAAADASTVGASDVNVGGDNGREAFVGKGSLAIPAGQGASAGTRRAAASCAGCTWHAFEACKSIGSMCVKPECPAKEKWLEIWLRRPSAPDVKIDGSCYGPKGPTTMAELESGVRAAFVRRVPQLRPAFQPSAGGLTGLPVVFRSQQSAHPRSFNKTLVGFHVSVFPSVTWTWTFGGGNPVRTDKPGGVWPDHSISHTFGRAGSATVEVSAIWRARYSVDGLGDFTVEEPVVQRRSITVPIKPAKAVLLAGR